MTGITLVERPEEFTQENAFVAHITEANCKRDLLSELSTKLKFPGYFGFNWDALYDCLCDLSWIEETEVVLVHDCVVFLNESEHATYRDILNDALNSWAEGEAHSLKVIFRK